MVQCLRKYEWVKLPRFCLPEGRGIMGAWARLASHAACRKGQALYCGYSNEVMPGMWSGGIVGLKRILGAKNRQTALDIMNRLSEYGYLSYTLEAKTKKFTYRILDWVVRCSGRACAEGSVYAINGYGFLCLSGNLTERLAEHGHIFEEADAWLDLWCHTVARDPRNAFSYLAGDSVPQCIHHIRNPWDTLGLREDQGVEVFQKAWRCFLSAPSSRKLWLCPVQFTH